MEKLGPDVIAHILSFTDPSLSLTLIQLNKKYYKEYKDKRDSFLQTISWQISIEQDDDRIGPIRFKVGKFTEDEDFAIEEREKYGTVLVAKGKGGKFITSLVAMQGQPMCIQLSFEECYIPYALIPFKEREDEIQIEAEIGHLEHIPFYEEINVNKERKRIKEVKKGMVLCYYR